MKLSDVIAQNTCRMISEKSMTRYHLESKSGLTGITLNSILAGATERPRKRTLEYLAHALGCSVQALLMSDEPFTDISQTEIDEVYFGVTKKDRKEIDGRAAMDTLKRAEAREIDVFRTNLEYIMRVHGISQKRLQDESGLSRMSIKRILVDNDPVDFKTLIALSRAVKMPVYKMLDPDLGEADV